MLSKFCDIFEKIIGIISCIFPAHKVIEFIMLSTKVLPTDNLFIKYIIK